MSERSEEESCDGCREESSPLISPDHAVNLFSEDIIEGLDTCAHLMGKVQRNMVTHKVSVYPAQKGAILESLSRCQQIFEFIDDIS